MMQPGQPGKAPLLLLPGDPLPHLEGVEIVADRARWLLLVTAPAEKARALRATLQTTVAERRGLALQVLAFGGDPSGDGLVPDPEGELARRLGALPASGELLPVAVLVEPRGAVHLACTGSDFEAAARAALADDSIWPSPP
jgi:hypothetical protein